MKFYIFFLVFFMFNTLCDKPKKAFVIVPVADLVGAPIQTFHLAKTVKASYEKIALCGGPNQPSAGCPRIHQLLANDIVEIISLEPGSEGDDGQACIRVPSTFYITPDSKSPQNMFWTQTKNLLTLEKLQRKNISLQYTPESPSFLHKKVNHSKNVIILKKPFFDTITKQLFSAGTRFVYDPEKSTCAHYASYIFDKSVTAFKLGFIPIDAAIQSKPQSWQEAVGCFVKLLKEWAHCSHGAIPYVWGGSSFSTCCCAHAFKETHMHDSKKRKYTMYECAVCNKRSLSGLDCSGLVLLAAKICGIPYFFKNTYTLMSYLSPLPSKQSINEGDLIWIPGHVMVVSDIKKNTLIEARGYSHGYGIVHEITLSNVFKGIHTYHDLLHAYTHKSTLIRLNKAGQPVEEIKTFKLFSLKSLWK